MAIILIFIIQYGKFVFIRSKDKQTDRLRKAERTVASTFDGLESGVGKRSSEIYTTCFGTRWVWLWNGSALYASVIHVHVCVLCMYMYMYTLYMYCMYCTCTCIHCTCTVCTVHVHVYTVHVLYVLYMNTQLNYTCHIKVLNSNWHFRFALYTSVCTCTCRASLIQSTLLWHILYITCMYTAAIITIRLI